MFAAIYARKSTEQTGMADEQKSVTRQIDHARQYAQRKGWIVDEAHVYVDDGISGAEFANRPGFLRLMNSLKPRPAFQVLVMSEESRLGREAIETAYALKQLVQAGVRVFFYLEDRERTLDSPTDKIMLSLTTFADELEREKARQRTYDAMLRKAKAGHVTGGRVFGYDNLEIVDSQGRRQHVERRINVDEAAIVARIFERCVAGAGLRTIAKELNEDRAPAPRAQQDRPRAWAPSSVREVLYRDLYRGRIVWNKTQKRNAWGQTKQRQRPASEHIEIPAPSLRVVAESLWDAAHERLEGVRQTYLRATDGRLWGRPMCGIEAKHLLTGLARCGGCGGTMIVRSRQHGRQRAYFYACSSFHFRGKVVCPNSLAMRLADADGAILEALERELLDEQVLAEALDRAVAQRLASAENGPAQQRTIRRELDQIISELDRLTAVILAGGDAATVVQAMREREKRREQLQRELRDLERPLPARQDAARLRASLVAKLGDWKALLRSHVPQARQMIRKLVTGRIVFTPQPATRRYAFTLTGTLAAFLGGEVCPYAVASPAGPDRSWTREIPGEVKAA
jgi:DNA invertase Pin-like site-specific DNA recombinase